MQQHPNADKIQLLTAGVANARIKKVRCSSRVEMIFTEREREREPRGEFLSPLQPTPPNDTDKRVSSFNLQRQISGSQVIRIQVTSILSPSLPSPRLPYIDDIRLVRLRPRNLNQLSTGSDQMAALIYISSFIVLSTMIPFQFCISYISRLGFIRNLDNPKIV